MEKTPRLALDYVLPQQAQKHVTVNDGLRRLDALVQLAVVSRTVAAEPAAPADGDAYILPAGKTGAHWSAMAAQSIAAFQDGAWTEIAPRDGFLAYVADENAFYRRAAGNWGAFSGAAAESAPKFGVNATADATNRLAVKSDASLFSHDDVTPGSGDHKAKINKSAAGKTASLVFQDASSGRAEIGLVGDDNLHVKVSADGAAWADAIVIDRTSGNVGVGSAPIADRRLNVRGSNLSNANAGDIHVEKEGYFAFCFLDTYDSAAGTSSFSVQRRARGTIAAPAAVQNGDAIGGFSFRAFAPSGAFVQTGLVYGSIDAAPSGASVPMALRFFTGTTSAVERLRITSAGDIGVGLAAPTTKLDVDGPVKVKSYAKAGLPPASAVGAGAIVYVSDEVGGAVIAFSDGASWRRVTDRAAVS